MTTRNITRVEGLTPSVLVWAREEAGLSVAEAAKVIGLAVSKKSTAAQKLSDIECGRSAPTQRQLSKMARAYYRPLLTFYLQEKPLVAKMGADFRTLSDTDVPDKLEAARLNALLRDIHARQSIVRSLLEDDEDVQPLSFVGSVDNTREVTAAVAKLHTALRIDGSLRVHEALKARSADALFASLRARVEDLGAFVILAGNLGSHRTNISADIFRGFALADDIAPFIVINDQDAKVARSFTLIHELAHIFIKQTGLSAAPATGNMRTSTARVERFCNDVVGEFLLPKVSLPHAGPIVDIDSAKTAIEEIADSCKVSESMVAYRLFRADFIDEDAYDNLRDYYALRWKEYRENRRERTREKGGGPSYYVVQRNRVGKALLNLAWRAIRTDELTYTKAAKLLGVKPTAVAKLLRDTDPAQQLAHS